MLKTGGSTSLSSPAPALTTESASRRPIASSESTPAPDIVQPPKPKDGSHKHVCALPTPASIKKQKIEEEQVRPLPLPPLLRACVDDDFNAVKNIISRDVDLEDVGPSGIYNTPLHHAIMNLNPNVVSLLLNKGARLEAKNAFGLTAMEEGEIAAKDFPLAGKEIHRLLTEEWQRRSSLHSQNI